MKNPDLPMRLPLRMPRLAFDQYHASSNIEVIHRVSCAAIKRARCVRVVAVYY
jgi:hypothetical protein